MFQTLFGGSSSTSSTLGGLNLGGILGGVLGVKDLSCIGSQAFPESRYNEYMSSFRRYCDQLDSNINDVSMYNYFFDTWTREIAVSELFISGYKSVCSKDWHNKAVNEIKSKVNAYLSNCNYSIAQKVGSNQYYNNGASFPYNTYVVTSLKTVGVVPTTYTPQTTTEPYVYTPTQTYDYTPTTVYDSGIYDTTATQNLTLPGSGSISLGNTTLGWGSSQIKPIWLLAGAGVLIFMLMKKK